MARRVTFHYVLRDPAGRLIETSRGGEPTVYTEGAGEVIDGLESRLRGACAGQSLVVRVPAAEGYGVRDESQVQAMPRTFVPVDGELRPGDRFQTGPERDAPILTVVRVQGDEVVLDANHPLAGVDLTFEVEIVAVDRA